LLARSNNSKLKLSKYDVMVNWSSVVIGSRVSSLVNDASAKMVWNDNCPTVSIRKRSISGSSKGILVTSFKI